MTGRRLTRYALVATAVVLTIPALWVAAVWIVPTNWAKAHVIAAMERRTGRSVRLDRISMGVLGGLRLSNLEIGSPQSVDDPWLKAASVHVEFGFFNLINNGFRPDSLEIDGASVRVMRRADGSLELAEFLRPDDKPRDTRGARRAASPVAFRLHSSTIIIIDEPSHTRLHLQNVEGEGVRNDHTLIVRGLRGQLNGGPFQFAGELDRSPADPNFHARFRADDVVLDDGMSVLRYAVPVLAGAPLNLTGRMDADFYIQGHGRIWPEISRTLTGQGNIGIKPVELDGAPLIAELSKIADLSRQGRVASLRSDFAIKDRRITTDHFTLNIGRVPMTLTGSTDFDGRMDYRINLSALADRIPDRARRLLGELNVELGSLTTLTLRGTVNQMVVQVNGVSLDRRLVRDVGLKREEREKLRTLGRQILDHLNR
jgi:AsmA protein